MSTEPPKTDDPRPLPVAPEASRPSTEKGGVSPWQIFVPVIVLGLGVFAMRAIINSKPEPQGRERSPRVAVVETITVQPQEVHLSVDSQGTVRPRVQTRLTAEVSGRVEAVSPNFRPGGFISQGEVLVRLDPTDYEAAVADANANLAQARFALAQEEALAEQALADWEELGRGEASDLALRKPQMEQARSATQSAEAALVRAQRNRERTQMRAPYS